MPDTYPSNMLPQTFCARAHPHALRVAERACVAWCNAGQPSDGPTARAFDVADVAASILRGRHRRSLGFAN